MPNDVPDNDISGGAAIEQIADAPAAFAGIAEKLNEVIAKLNGQNFKAGPGLHIASGTHGHLISFAPVKQPQTWLDKQPNSFVLTDGSGTGGVGSNLESRVAALELLLENVTGPIQIQNIDYCDGGPSDFLILS